MMTTIRYGSDLQEAYGTLEYARTAYAELPVVCVWSVVGLTLSALLFAAGFGDGIAQALMMAG